MNHAEPSTIEVEVIEIDGNAPKGAASSDTSGPTSQRPAPRTNWQSRIRQLDRRWWPVWVVLGLIAGVILCTLGVAVALFLIIFYLIRRIIRVIKDVFGV